MRYETSLGNGSYLVCTSVCNNFPLMSLTFYNIFYKMLVLSLGRYHSCFMVCPDRLMALHGSGAAGCLKSAPWISG